MSHLITATTKRAGQARPQPLGQEVVMFDEYACRVCGCTDDDCYCCVMHTGDPCHWVELDLCSSCVGDNPCSGED